MNDWLENWSRRSTTVLTGLVLGASLVAGLDPFEWAWLGWPLSLAGTGGGLGVAFTRRRWSTLPLQLSPVALFELRDDADIYRFRVRLGRGRPMHQTVISLCFRTASGEVIPLEVERSPVSCWLGPRTLLLLDATHRCREAGCFEMVARVRSGGQLWSASARWPRERLASGRFQPGFVILGGRLRWRVSEWDRRWVDSDEATRTSL